MTCRPFISWTSTGIAAAVVSLAGLGSQAEVQNLSGTVTIDGSSTVYPITEAVAEEFRKEYPHVQVPVGVSGTGGGFKRFATSETDVSNASRPIKDKEYKAAKDNNIEFIEIPVAYDGLSIVVNRENTFIDKLTIDQLKKIFLDEPNKARTWKDVNGDWPAEEIRIFAPGTDSGTFDYFKEVMTDKGGSIRADMQVSEDDNVLVTGVAGEVNAIGFFGCAYYFENKDKLRAVPIVNEEGKSVAPTAETIENGSYSPFSRPLFIYVNKASARKPQVKAFVEFYLEKGPALADEVGYVRLPSEIYERAKHNFKRNKTGTQYMNENLEKITGPVTKIYQKL